MSDQRDFFISFTGDDIKIATAINDALNEAGFSTWFHPKDKPKGAGIADWMETALDATTQMIALCSPTYFDRSKGYSRAERQSMFWEDPTNNQPLLILVKVEEVKFPRLIAQNEYISLVGMQRPEAAAKLVSEMRGEDARKARIKAESIARDRRPPEVFNVPGQPNRYFSGREIEMERLHERIKSGTATAITAVAGMGGIGKSTLAREYAHRYGLATRFGGVWWIDADTETGILDAYDKLAKHPATDIAEGADLRETAANARDWLGRQKTAAPWLVIFDNAQEDSNVHKWLPRGTVKGIITTRYAHFDAIAEPMSLDVWDEETTVGFLKERTGRGTEAELASLARRLGGLPLAAEQAGAFLRETGVSFATYEDRLTEMLQEPLKPTSGYPHPVYATFSVALDDLAGREHGPVAVDLLRLCAFLSPDGVELVLLAAIAEGTDILPEPLRGTLADELARERAIRALTAYSLMRRGEGDEWGETLVLHRLLAEVARDLMTAAQHALWAGAAVTMIARLMPSESHGGNPTTAPAVWPLCARLVPHTQTLRGLRPRADSNGKALVHVLNQTAGYLISRGDREGALDLLRRRVAIDEIVHKENPKEIATGLSNLAYQLGQRESDWDEAEAAYARALRIQEAHLAPGDPSLAITLSNFGGLLWRRKDYAGAVELTKRAAEIDKAANGEASSEYAVDLSNLGTIYADRATATGDPALRQKERDLTERAAAVTRAARGMRHPETTARYHNLAVMHSDAGDKARAAEDMATCVAIFLSLDLAEHPQTQTCIAILLHFWTESGHRAWVAEDPSSRHFGPPSPVTGATE